MTTLTQQIIPCPVAIAETGYVLIVADATNAPALQPQYKWDYQAVCYDPVKRIRHGRAFEVTKAEVEEWTAKQN